MRKLKLDLDQLAVETFEAGDGDEKAGTVRGHVSIACEPSEPDSCVGHTCDGAIITCNGDCPKDSYDTRCYAC